MVRESGKDMTKNILILSRASGTPVVAKALEYAADLVKGGLEERVKEEFQKAKKAGLDEILANRQNPRKKRKRKKPSNSLQRKW